MVKHKILQEHILKDHQAGFSFCTEHTPDLLIMAIFKSMASITVFYLFCMASAYATGIPVNARRVVLLPPSDSPEPRNISFDAGMPLNIRHSFEDLATGEMVEVQSVTPVSLDEARRRGFPLSAGYEFNSPRRTLTQALQDKARHFTARLTKRVLPYLDKTGYVSSTCQITGQQSRDTSIRAEVDTANRHMYIVNSGKSRCRKLGVKALGLRTLTCSRFRQHGHCTSQRRHSVARRPTRFFCQNRCQYRSGPRRFHPGRTLVSSSVLLCPQNTSLDYERRWCCNIKWTWSQTTIATEAEDHISVTFSAPYLPTAQETCIRAEDNGDCKYAHLVVQQSTCSQAIAQWNQY